MQEPHEYLPRQIAGTSMEQPPQMRAQPCISGQQETVPMAAYYSPRAFMQQPQPSPQQQQFAYAQPLGPRST